MDKRKKDKKDYRMTVNDLRIAKENIKRRITRLHQGYGRQEGAKTNANS